jgi:hypothetical protein
MSSVGEVLSAATAIPLGLKAFVCDADFLCWLAVVIC